jgi:RHS repeat-associated protein
MRLRRLTMLVCASLGLAASVPGYVSATLAPIGAHHAGRGADVGGGGGGYGTAVALDFPGERGGLPIPVSVINGGPALGAAGRGWDVPLSMIRENRSMAGRRPTSNISAEPSAPLQMTLTLLGRSVTLIAQGGDWVPQESAEGLVVHRDGADWKVYDGNGNTYTFGKRIGDLWLLTKIEGAGNSRVDLNYCVSAHPLTGSPPAAALPCGVAPPAGASSHAWSIDLESVAYNFGPSGNAKHRVLLKYDDERAQPLSRSVHPIDNVSSPLIFARHRVLDAVEVVARDVDSAQGTEQRQLRYELHYKPDPDTQQPQLQSVTVKGRLGTEEADTPLLLARYQYGSATQTVDDKPVLKFDLAAEVLLPPGASHTSLSSSERVSEDEDNHVSTFVMPNLLGDVSGDGLADLVFKNASGNGLTVARQRPTTDGKPVLNDSASIGSFTDNVMGKTSLGTYTTKRLPATYVGINYSTQAPPSQIPVPNPRYTASRTDTWSQMTDVNGDGRTDLIVADEYEGYRWAIYLNVPDPAFPQKTQWQKRIVNVGHLASLLTARNHELDGQHLPVMRQYTGQEFEVAQCWKFDGNEWDKVDPRLSSEQIPLSVGAPNPCPYINDAYKWDGEVTTTEWQLMDFNGDTGLDLVLGSAPTQTVALDDGEECRVYFNDVSQACPGPANVSTVADLHRSTSRPFRVRAAQGAKMAVVFGVSPAVLVPQSLPVEVASAHRGISDWERDYDQPPLCHTVYDEHDIGMLVCQPGIGNQPGLGEIEISHDQIENQSLRDINGDGLIDLVADRKAYLGTGSGFSAYGAIDLPKSATHTTQQRYKKVTHQGGGETLEEIDNCPAGEPNPPPVVANATVEYRDISGDGIPDMVTHSGKVHLGTGVGFGPEMSIKQSEFRISQVASECDGSLSRTTWGLYDMDGDGRTDVVGHGSDRLRVFSLKGSGGLRALDAGLLAKIENGHGARTEITYVSAKDEGTTLHQMPYPEVVAGKVRMVQETPGMPDRLSEMRYAYGNARQIYDAISGRFVSQYGRTVAMTYADPTTSPEVATAVISDTLPRSVPGVAAEAFRMHLLAGSTQQVTTLTSATITDPRPLLTLNLGNPGAAQLMGQSTYYYDTKQSVQAGSPANLTCAGLLDPYAATATYLDTCTARGFAFSSEQEIWRGTASPQGGSLANVASGSKVLDVDAFGRVTRVFIGNDTRRDDDDLCVETTYAVPNAGGFPRVLAAVSEKRVGTCLRGNLSTVLASERYEYDQLPLGKVSVGRPTSREADRRDSQTGVVLGALQTGQIKYNGFGNPEETKTVNGALSRTTATQYDAFQLVPRSTTVTASDAVTMTTEIESHPFTLQVLSSTGPDGTAHGATYDGFGRVMTTTLKSHGGSEGVMSKTRYVGFEPDGEARSIETKSFDNPVPPTQVSIAVGHKTKTYLDAYGRAAMSEIDLGSDYAEDLLVGGVLFDTNGRVAFQADPFPFQNGSNPATAVATAYGTSFYYNADGTTSCTVRGTGPQLFTQQTNLAAETLPTCYSYAYENGTLRVGVKSADALLSTLPQAGVERQERFTAAGRLLSRTTLQSSVRLEFAEYQHDRLGNRTGMTRYKTPHLSLPPDASNTVQWSWTYDSLGQMLTQSEPNTATRTNDYDVWGALVKTSTPASGSTPAQQQLMTYDGLGRLRHSEEVVNGAVVPDTVRDFVYDTGIVGPAQYVRGRLAYAKSPTGTTHLSYDAFGNVSQRNYVVPGDADSYVEKATFDADGALKSVGLQLPDNRMNLESVSYSYDSAGRLRKAVSEVGTLLNVVEMDAFGRELNVQLAQQGVSYQATYAPAGRRLMKDFTLKTGDGVRTTKFPSYDPLGRELERFESDVNATTNVSYDALGRLAVELRTQPGIRDPLSRKEFSYDALGNLKNQKITHGDPGGNAVLTFRTDNPDMLCRVDYAASSSGTACNVVHDALGNIVQQPAIDGLRSLQYLPSGPVSKISKPDGTQARFRYDAFGSVQELDIAGPTADTRTDRRYGGMIELRTDTVNGVKTKRIARSFPLGGASVTRSGASGEWVFALGDQRGNRYFVGASGQTKQKVDYAAYGKPASTGAQPGSPDYQREQWNGGDNLAAFGVSHLGARLYDPMLGRFLSRDPLVRMGSAATANPYSFADNDPVNLSDPSGLSPIPCVTNASGGGGMGCAQAGSGSPTGGSIVGNLLYIGFSLLLNHDGIADKAVAYSQQAAPAQPNIQWTRGHIDSRDMPNNVFHTFAKAAGNMASDFWHGSTDDVVDGVGSVGAGVYAAGQSVTDGELSLGNLASNFSDAKPIADQMARAAVDKAAVGAIGYGVGTLAGGMGAASNTSLSPVRGSAGGGAGLASKAGTTEFAGGVPQVYASDLSHVTGKAATARNLAIEGIIKEDFPDLKLTFTPRYNPFIPLGVAERGKGTQIGRNMFSSRADLRDTIVHEELHHRWWKRGIGDHHPRFSEKERRFYKVIERYKRMRGWKE